MTGHTRTDGLAGMALPPQELPPESARPGSAAKLQCHACPVLCQIAPGRAGACDRYANRDGALVRLDPPGVLRKTPGGGGAVGWWWENRGWGGGPRWCLWPPGGLARVQPVAPTPAPTQRRHGPAICCTPTRCSSPVSALPPPTLITSRPLSSSAPGCRAWTW